MITNGKMTSMSNSKITRKAASRLVAVPQIPFHPKVMDMKPVTPSPSSANIPFSSHLTGYNFPDKSAAKPTEKSQSGTATEASAIASPEPIEWEYNVYATSFIPSSWRMINIEKPRTVIKNSSRHQVDYSKYVSTFAGTAFLPEQATDSQGQQQSQSRGLSAQSYLQYFKTLRCLESSAKELENEKNALYMVPLYPVQTPSGLQLWSMSIPGLREDNPFLEMGDMLQLRQLWVDPSGNLIEVPVQTDPSISGHAIYYNKGWTGALHETCIYSINRAKEMVYVKAEGLMQLHLGLNWVPMIVNSTLR